MAKYKDWDNFAKTSFSFSLILKGMKEKKIQILIPFRKEVLQIFCKYKVMTNYDFPI